VVRRAPELKDVSIDETFCGEQKLDSTLFVRLNLLEGSSRFAEVKGLATASLVPT